MTEAAEPLSAQARRDLLELARRSVQAYFQGAPAPRLSSDRAEAFGQPRGLFVTFKRDGQLRGCIGTLSPEGDLTRVVAEYARRAAFEDPRFPPIAAEELPATEIEISVLTAPRRLEDPGEIVIGRDGLIVEGRGRRGLLLPQVAMEWGFPPTQFLEEVCRKAGLPRDVWRDPAVTVWLFQAEVFGEAESKG